MVDFASTHYLSLVSVAGIEPTLLGPKPRVIPFHHAEKIEFVVGRTQSD